jgi:predicted transcriptional regulator
MTFEEFEEQLKPLTDKKGLKISPRTILNAFGCERRTKFNVIHIKQYFVDKELETHPDFLSVHIDWTVEVKKKPRARIKNGEKEIVDYDPVSRVQLLDSASRTPVSVKKEANISEAVTKMMLYNFSQLPVMKNEYSLEGIISWETIGSKLFHDKPKGKVEEFMETKVTTIPHDTTLFDASKRITTDGLVFVKGADGKIYGPVTNTDIGQQFVTMSEPFLILEQIENHVRMLLDGKFALDKLKEISQEEESSRKIESISDLTFGEYIRLMENPENWEAMSLSIDRATFIKRLEEIRRIRNDVMHFHPDGISTKDYNLLRQTNEFFEGLSKIK